MTKGIGWLRGVAARVTEKLGGTRDREVDLTLGHPKAPQLLALIRAARWRECDTLFLALPADERFVLLTYCAQQNLPMTGLDAWASGSPFAGRLFRGTALTYAAWEARSSTRGANVSEEQFARFHSILEESWTTLLAVHESAPQDPEPLTRLIPVAMGLETGADDIRALFDRLLKTGTPHLGAALYAAEALSEKWAGSQAEALEFAHEAARHHPHYRAAVACAHVENWLWEFVERQPSAETYFQRPDVQHDLYTCWGGEADFARRTDYFRFHALNYHAFCFQAMDDAAPLSEALVLLDGGVTAKPWIYRFDSPVLAINKFRQGFELPPI